MLKRSCYITMKNCVGKAVHCDVIMEYHKDKMNHYDE